MNDKYCNKDYYGYYHRDRWRTRKCIFFMILMIPILCIINSHKDN